MKTKFFHKLAHIFSILILGTILGLSLQLVHAWTEPSVAPPGGNVGAPINTGGATQFKNGNFGVNGGVNGGVGICSKAGCLTGYTGTDYPTIKSTFSYLYFDVGSKYVGYMGTNEFHYYGEINSSGNINSAGYVQGYTGGSTYGLLNYAGYGGYFSGDHGIYSQDTAGYYTYIDSSSWGVYTNGNIYASDFLIGATGKWASSLGGASLGAATTVQASYCGWGVGAVSCPAGYVMTGFQSSDFDGNNACDVIKCSLLQ